jgi:hypothetical protein
VSGVKSVMGLDKPVEGTVQSRSVVLLRNLHEKVKSDLGSALYSTAKRVKRKVTKFVLKNTGIRNLRKKLKKIRS